MGKVPGTNGEGPRLFFGPSPFAFATFPTLCPKVQPMDPREQKGPKMSPKVQPMDLREQKGPKTSLKVQPMDPWEQKEPIMSLKVQPMDPREQIGPKKIPGRLDVGGPVLCLWGLLEVNLVTGGKLEGDGVGGVVGLGRVLADKAADHSGLEEEGAVLPGLPLHTGVERSGEDPVTRMG